MSESSPYSVEFAEAYSRTKRVLEAMTNKMRIEGHKDSEILGRIQLIVAQIENASTEECRSILEQLEREWLEDDES